LPKTCTAQGEGLGLWGIQVTLTSFNAHILDWTKFAYSCQMSVATARYGLCHAAYQKWER
jgi:hypothetical protein